MSFRLTYLNTPRGNSSLMSFLPVAAGKLQQDPDEVITSFPRKRESRFPTQLGMTKKTSREWLDSPIKSDNNNKFLGAYNVRNNKTFR